MFAISPPIACLDLYILVFSVKFVMCWCLIMSYCKCMTLRISLSHPLQTDHDKQISTEVDGDPKPNNIIQYYNKASDQDIIQLKWRQWSSKYAQIVPVLRHCRNSHTPNLIDRICSYCYVNREQRPT